jgi:selenocysteine lyase/cysteine desulfurase
MIFSVKEIAELAHQKNILVGVDGAQTPGMLEIDLKDLGCDFFATSAHKWLMGPKGMGVFYADGEKRKNLKPLIVSGMYYLNDSCRKFENYNTRNFPELLGLGAAFDFRALVGPQRIQKRIYQLKHYFRDQVAQLPFIRVKTPEDDLLSAGITVIEILNRDAREIQQKLLSSYNIDCRAMTTHKLNGLRISLGLCVVESDIDRLVDVLTDLAG